MSEVKLTKSEYDKMQRELAKLYALEAGGVDNWEWYDESLEDWHKENALDELMHGMCDFIHDAAIYAEVDFPGGYECGPNIHVDHETAMTAVKGIIKAYQEFLKND